MGKKFHFHGEWKDAIHQALQQFGGTIPSDWTLDMVITEAAKIAKHPNPHPLIPAAKKALRDLMASEEVHHADGSIGTSRRQQQTANRKVRPPKQHTNSNKQKNDLSNLFDYLTDAHRALMLLGDGLTYLKKELATWKERGEQISRMHAELKHMIHEVISDND